MVKKITKNKDMKNHSEAIEYLTKELIELGIIEELDDIKAVGHRVVQLQLIYMIRVL